MVQIYPSEAFEKIMQYDEVLRILLGTSTGERLGAIQSLYSDLDRAQKRFTKTFDISCPEGCGSCCEHFFPDVTMAEAEYMAMGILFEGREEDVLEKLHSIKDRTFCPLYRKDSPYHCTVYGVRPLVCRLFGASAVRDKNAKPAFGDCRWNTKTLNLSSEDLEKHSEDLVIMGDYGLRLEEIQVEDTATYPLDEALEKAILKIKFLLILNNDDPEPEPNAS